MNTTNFTNFTVSLAWLCGLLVSCNSTDYISQESLPTSTPIIISNEEYTEEKFGDIKRKKDSIDEQYGRMNPEVISTTLNGYFRQSRKNGTKLKVVEKTSRHLPTIKATAN